MNKRTVPCRVCGKQFVPCGKSSAEIGAFNYREVACSEECGAEYLRRVLVGRAAAHSDEASVDGQMSILELQAERSDDANSMDTNESENEEVQRTEKRGSKKRMVSSDTEN